MLWRRSVACATLVVCAFASPALAQIPGQNVNMVSGTEWPGGDPFLQRQNEPSIAVSSRNPLHLLAGANDYRTVDLPGLPDAGSTGDAWLGLFKSLDGGSRWTSTLVPGYPQDSSPAGMLSPLKQYQAGADPIVRSGTHGLLYYGGLAFNRGEGQPSAVFVARYVDRNDKEAGDPYSYLGTSVVASSGGREFLDKPNFAVDLPRSGARECSINGVPTPAGPVYAAWSVFLGQSHPHSRKDDRDDDDDDDEEGKSNGTAHEVRSRIMFSRSLDCGRTWQKPVRLSDSRTNQAATIAVDPRNGHVYVAWRQFRTGKWVHAILVSKSTDGGRTFSRPRPIWGFFPFDQGTSQTSFRTNAYPTMTVDHMGRVYVAWAARGYAPGNHHPLTGDSRIVMSTSTNGTSWTFPRAVDNFPGSGHQFMPSLGYAGGRLQLLYYDLREDVSQVFERFVDELAILTSPGPNRRRHTLDLRTAQAGTGIAPAFASYSVTGARPSSEASRYLIGSRPGSNVIEQLQFNPPNLPLYAQGTLPFIGDYIEVGVQTFVPGPANAGAVSATMARSAMPPTADQWHFNGPDDRPIFHLTWADNRDVRPPPPGKTWQDYTPPEVTISNLPSKFDPTQNVPPCVPGQAGMRNSNIYSSRVTPGLVAGSPGNSKPLSLALPRAFVVFAQNTTGDLAAYRFTIANQPTGGAASFRQFSPLTSVDVLIAPKSSAARTVYVTSTDPDAQVRVDVVQIAAPAAPPLPGGLSATVILNPDITNPDITNPDITNPDITNPDITNAEVHNPDITNPDITNPDITNPDITNPDITNPDITNIEVANPDITNPDITNPDITNPDITNPDITNPDITNPDITNGAITDYSYAVTNNGNTTSQYNLNLATATGDDPAGFRIQLVVHRQYLTPVADGCNLRQQTQNQVVANIVHPDFVRVADLGNTDPADPALGNVTFWLDPGESVRVTLRVVDPDRNDGIVFDPTTTVVVSVVAAAVNSADAANGVVTPPFDFRPIAFQDVFALRTVLDVPAPGVLGNDAVPAGAAAQLVTGPAHAASFTLRPDGSFSYAPAKGFAGVDSFVYAAASPRGVSNPATVFLTVEGPRTLVVVNTDDSGPGSLRQALLDANAHEGEDVITFDIPGEGTGRRLQPRSALPALTGPVTIDGSTQPGYVAGEGPVIEIDGSYAGASNGVNVLGGGSVIRAVVVNRFALAGILLQGKGNNVVEASYIGTDRSGGYEAGNAGNGVHIIDSASNRIGGYGPESRNVISGNSGEGVRVDGAAATTNTIAGNFIGTDASGRRDLGNGASGIYIRRAPGNIVSGNVVSGNDGFAGVAICGRASFCGGAEVGTPGSNAGGTVVRDNRIGTDASGVYALANAGYGVSLDGTRGTLVGAPGVGNTIAFNGNDGIAILFADVDAVANDFNQNMVHSNGGLAIDLGDNGPTANDRGDADEGPNRLQNFPLLEQAFAYGERLTVTGTIDTTPGADVRLEFFASDGCGSYEYRAAPQARRFLGTATVQAGYGPTWFKVDLDAEAGGFEGVTATATVEGNTSELAACRSLGRPSELGAGGIH